MKKIICSILFGILFIASVNASTYKIKEGDTLWDLSAKNYGDPTLYTVLMEVNGITNPRTILNGTVITIPSKSEIQKIANETDSQKRAELISKANGGGSSNNSSNSNNNGNTVNLKNTPVDSSFDYVVNDELDLDKLQTINE